MNISNAELAIGMLGLNPWVSSFFYASALFLTLIYSSRAGSSFIYFQF